MNRHYPLILTVLAWAGRASDFFWDTPVPLQDTARVVFENAVPAPGLIIVTDHPTQRVTRLLLRMSEGYADAAEELLPLLYDELRTRAQWFMKEQSPNHTLQPTALVHEAYLKLVDQKEARWESRSHFLCVAAKAMRSVLVDHARAKGAEKRGGERRRLLLDDALASYEKKGLDLLDLDEALEELTSMDEQLSRIVELRFFGGLTVEETAEVLGISTPTVARGWRTARIWLYSQLTTGGLDGD